MFEKASETYYRPTVLEQAGYELLWTELLFGRGIEVSFPRRFEHSVVELSRVIEGASNGYLCAQRHRRCKLLNKK